MNATGTGDKVNAYEVFAEGAAATVIVTFLAGLHPKARARLEARKQRRMDLDGRPPRMGKDAQGNQVVIEPGRPPLAASVAELNDNFLLLSQEVRKIGEQTGQLARNGGGTVADAIHRMEDALTEKHEENQREIRNTKEVAERTATDLRELRGEIDIMTNAALKDHADLWTALSEAGFDRRDRQADEP